MSNVCPNVMSVPALEITFLHRRREGLLLFPGRKSPEGPPQMWHSLLGASVSTEFESHQWHTKRVPGGQRSQGPGCRGLSESPPVTYFF